MHFLRIKISVLWLNLIEINTNGFQLYERSID